MTIHGISVFKGWNPRMASCFSSFD